MSYDQPFRKSNFLSRLFLLIPIWLFATTALANSLDIDQSEARHLVQEGIIKPLPQILSPSSLSELGKVLEIELEEEKGIYIYEIETLDKSGVVHQYKLNAHDGTLLPKETED
jgi:uncharacterized membrane protein YkoI